MRGERDMSEQIEIESIDGSGCSRPGIFLLSESGDGSVALTFSDDSQTVIQAADDFFEALCKVRLELEKQGIRLKCYGGSRNVYPSAMSQGMGVGRKAYKLSLGSHARLADIVDIFDTGPDIELSTVKEQKEFFQQWLDGLAR